jgi:DNA polymerase-3 subunit epsilon
MHRRATLISAAAIAGICAILATFGWVTWVELSPTSRDLAARLGGEVVETVIIACILALLVIVVVVHLIYRAYAVPLGTLADEIRMIALSNPAHRPAMGGAAEVRDVVAAVGVLAERYQSLLVEMQDRVREAAAALEEERDTLAALMAKLSQGVVVCNLEGRVLLYNQQAQRLLAGPARQSGAGDWIGLGRSIHSVVDESLIHHALMALVHGRQRGENPSMVPFLAPRPGGEMLNLHLVPISGKSRQWHGYILTIDDITHRIARNARRALAFQALIERQRNKVASVRAAIETIQAYPEMEAPRLAEFHRTINEDIQTLSQGFEGVEDRVARDLEDALPTQSVLASDLIAAIERHLRDTAGQHMQVRVPLEPMRLRVDSYGLARSLIFLVTSIRQACRGETFSLNMEEAGTHAALVIAWSGARLHMEALRMWFGRNVLTDLSGSSMTLADVIEHHSGAIWPEAADAEGRPCLRLLLPLSDAVTPHAGDTEEPTFEQAFDFRLSRQGTRPPPLAETPLAEISYTVVDTETTGLAPGEGDEIIAIGAVRIVGGRILKREIFDTFVNPRVPIRESSAAIHGISQAMLRGQPRIEDVLPSFARFVEDTVIVGHNIDFDMRFFRNVEETAGVRFAGPVLDTLLLERLVSPNQQNRRLDAIAGRLGVAAVGRHTALGDALTTAEVYLALLPLLAGIGIATLADAERGCARAREGRHQF